jgi:hypothetical protein
MKTQNLIKIASKLGNATTITIIKGNLIPKQLKTAPSRRVKLSEK